MQSVGFLFLESEVADRICVHDFFVLIGKNHLEAQASQRKGALAREWFPFVVVACVGGLGFLAEETSVGLLAHAVALFVIDSDVRSRREEQGGGLLDPRQIGAPDGHFVGRELILEGLFLAGGAMAQYDAFTELDRSDFRFADICTGRVGYFPLFGIEEEKFFRPSLLSFGLVETFLIGARPHLRIAEVGQ